MHCSYDKRVSFVQPNDYLSDDGSFDVVDFTYLRSFVIFLFHLYLELICLLLTLGRVVSLFIAVNYIILLPVIVTVTIIHIVKHTISINITGSISLC